ncbi:Dam family site-specific DNA-(adenine-N6)-methyltransferase [Clostridium rectalis]|uniref:Dam family site-specific DNA-(adenine-N6)-methyltransferase n=1 Tax=Clostridium rectalis TaxID=2040295 RepID=UPI000F62E625|nr:Dam family site-specific DNA-(adenine-N6)-methyltransferase [Clostridium rectalis]
MKFQPVIKWSGSKRSQSEEIIKRIPKQEYNTYHEKFCGGCSILYQLLHSNIKFKQYICSDINRGLIDLWNEIKQNPNTVYEEYKKKWEELNIDDDKERKKQYFYTVRERYNKEHNPYDFMFIMRTTTNGMPRYNNKGNFNNSFHVTRNGIKPKTLEKIILKWSNLLNKYDVKFIHSDYCNIKPDKNDLLYLDPPYSGTKGMYYGTIDYNNLWDYLKDCKCDYLLSFDGKITSEDKTYEVPKEIYDKHEYIYSGNSSFRRVIGKSNKEYVEESLYIKSNIK